MPVEKQVRPLWSVSAHDLRPRFLSINLKNRIEPWKAKLLLNHQESGITVKHYTGTSDLGYFKPVVNTFAEWVGEQAKIAKIDVKLDDETVWLTQEQMARLFGKARFFVSPVNLPVFFHLDDIEIMR